MRKTLYWIGGFFFLSLGGIGLVLPLLPTTPLVILSAICFSHSSKRLETWLCNSRIFGEFIENYRTGCGISKWRKYGSIAFLWFGLITSMIALRMTATFVILPIVGVCVTMHLLMLKSRK